MKKEKGEISLLMMKMSILFFYRYVKDPSQLASLVVPNGGPSGGHVTGSGGWRRTGSDGMLTATNTIVDQIRTPSKDTSYRKN